MNGASIQRRLNDIKGHYDVAVIGAGIHGAAVAWEAASRGLSIILLDKGDFGCGTSSNSLKTIHGGLRSLQRLDFIALRENSQERRALMRIAPHLVQPLQCVIPTYRKLSKSRLVMGAGLKLYNLAVMDRNAGLDPALQLPPAQIITRQEMHELVPELDDAAVTGGACWHDAQVYNTERLVLAFVLAARQAGARVVNYLLNKEYIVKNNKVAGLLAQDPFCGEAIKIEAGAVIDCTGPWAAQNSSFQAHAQLGRTHQVSPPVSMARAVNLIIRKRITSCALGARTCTDQVDNRLLFIVPWRTGSMIGTWYYHDANVPEHLSLSGQELADCLNQINSIFPALDLTPADVTFVHLGLLPAYPGSDNSVGEPRLWGHSRIIEASQSGGPGGLFWLQGTKLTTARAQAVKTIDRVARYLKKPIQRSQTYKIPLYGGEIADYASYQQNCMANLANHWTRQTITRLQRNYGSNLDAIISKADDDETLVELVPGSADVVKAELSYIIENEQVYRLSDLLLRRTDIGSFAQPAEATIAYCADVMAEYWHWNEPQREENIAEFLLRYSHIAQTYSQE